MFPRGQLLAQPECPVFAGLADSQLLSALGAERCPLVGGLLLGSPRFRREDLRAIASNEYGHFLRERKLTAYQLMSKKTY